VCMTQRAVKRNIFQRKKDRRGGGGGDTTQKKQDKRGGAGKRGLKLLLSLGKDNDIASKKRRPQKSDLY